MNTDGEPLMPGDLIVKRAIEERAKKYDPKGRCPICKQFFATRDGRDTHIALEHKEGKMPKQYWP